MQPSHNQNDIKVSGESWGLCDGTIQKHHAESVSIIKTVLEMIYINGRFDPCVDIIDNVFNSHEERHGFFDEWMTIDHLCDHTITDWTIDYDLHMEDEDQSDIEQRIIAAEFDIDVTYANPEVPYVVDIDVELTSREGKHDVVSNTPVVTIDAHINE